jgi:hypothetical protein
VINPLNKHDTVTGLLSVDAPYYIQQAFFVLKKIPSIQRSADANRLIEELDKFLDKLCELTGLTRGSFDDEE